MVVGWWCHVTCPVIAPSLAPLAIQSTTTMASLLLLWITSGWCQTWESQTYTILLRSSCFCSRTHKVEHSCLCSSPPFACFLSHKLIRSNLMGKLFPFLLFVCSKSLFCCCCCCPRHNFVFVSRHEKKKPLGLCSTVKLSFQHHRCPEKKNNFSFSSPYEHAVQSVWKKERKTQDFSFPLIKYTHTHVQTD